MCGSNVYIYIYIYRYIIDKYGFRFRSESDLHQFYCQLNKTLRGAFDGLGIYKLLSLFGPWLAFQPPKSWSFPRCRKHTWLQGAHTRRSNTSWYLSQLLEPAGQSARIHQFALVIKSLGQYLHCTNTLEPPEVTALPLIQDTLRASLVRLCPRRTRTLRARTRQWSPRMADSHRHGQPEVSKCNQLMQESKMESWTLWLRCTETTIDSKCPTKAVS